MKFQCLRLPFLEKVRLLASVLKGNRINTSPILHNVLINAGGFLKLTATNTEQLVTAEVECGTSKYFRTTCNIQKLADSLQFLSGETVECVYDGKRLRIESGDSSYELPTLSADEFPKLEFHLNGSKPLEIEAGPLRKAIATVAPVQSVDEVRTAICGTRLECANKQVRVIAFDGKQLAMVTLDGYLRDFSATVPHRAVPGIIAALGGESAQITVSEGAIRVSGNGITVESKLIEAPYPNVQQRFPKEFGSVVKVDRDAFMEKVKAVAIVMSKTRIWATFRFMSSGVEMEGESPEHGKAKAKFETECGFSKTTYLPPDNFLPALSRAPSNDLTIKFADDDPAIFLESGNYLAVISPMRPDAVS